MISPGSRVTTPLRNNTGTVLSIESDGRLRIRWEKPTANGGYVSRSRRTSIINLDGQVLQSSMAAMHCLQIMRDGKPC